jgi:hypothetical protein
MLGRLETPLSRYAKKSMTDRNRAGTPTKTTSQPAVSDGSWLVRAAATNAARLTAAKSDTFHQLLQREPRSSSTIPKKRQAIRPAAIENPRASTPRSPASQKHKRAVTTFVLITHTLATLTR